MADLDRLPDEICGRLKAQVNDRSEGVDYEMRWKDDLVHGGWWWDSSVGVSVES